MKQSQTHEFSLCVLQKQQTRRIEYSIGLKYQYLKIYGCLNKSEYFKKFWFVKIASLT